MVVGGGEHIIYLSTILTKSTCKFLIFSLSIRDELHEHHASCSVSVCGFAYISHWKHSVSSLLLNWAYFRRMANIFSHEVYPKNNEKIIKRNMSPSWLFSWESGFCVHAVFQILKHMAYWIFSINFILFLIFLSWVLEVGCAGWLHRENKDALPSYFPKKHDYVGIFKFCLSFKRCILTL